MPHTLEDIAKISGYSRSTVSRVINGERGVSKKAQQKIGKIIEELNFHPNQAARALAAGRMNTIGLLIPETLRFIFTDPYIQHLSSSISQACQNNDYSLILWLTEPEYERQSIQRHIQSGVVDGFIAASTDFDEPLVEALQRSNRPFVLIGGQEFNVEINFVDADNVMGGQIATQHLIDRGYQRIATITGPIIRSSGRDRLVGYQKALQQNLREIDPSLISKGNFTRESGYACAKQLLPLKPDAIFIASDFMAMGAINAIQEAGLLIPDDIAIVSFDDIPQAKDMGLSTVHQPTKEIGELAVDILLKKINRPERDIHQAVLPPYLVHRKTS
jgi:LacI family transcriptional regulator